MSAPNTQMARVTINELHEFLTQKAVLGQIQAAAKADDKAVARIIRCAMTMIQAPPRKEGQDTLMHCTPVSLAKGIVKAAELRLELADVLGQAYMIPRRNKGKLEAVFQIGYRGLIALVERSPKISRVGVPRVVKKNDEFAINYGIQASILHRPCIQGDPGPSIGYYAVAHFKDGSAEYEYMSRDECVKHRARFAPRNPIWDSDFDSMAQKTVLIRLCKRMPLTVEVMTAVMEEDISSAEPSPLANVNVRPPRSQEILGALEENSEEIVTAEGEVIQPGQQEQQPAQREPGDDTEGIEGHADDNPF